MITKTKKKTVFVAGDGTEFETKEECKLYEDSLLYKINIRGGSISCIPFEVSAYDRDFQCEWYRVINEYDLEELLQYLSEESDFNMEEFKLEIKEYPELVYVVHHNHYSIGDDDILNCGLYSEFKTSITNMFKDFDKYRELGFPK